VALRAFGTLAAMTLAAAIPGPLAEQKVKDHGGQRQNEGSGNQAHSLFAQRVAEGFLKQVHSGA
jgi:hypothetical protein